jgi:peptidoglycan/LPS O-acetylase OafA/YrhL
MSKNNFDLLRIYAAFQVLFQHSIFHLYQNSEIDGKISLLNSLMQYIHGVPVFFLISGFLITMSYERNPSLKEYIRNRVLRIYPALYMNLLFSLFILYIFGFLSFRFELIPWLLAQTTLFQFYNIDIFRDFGTGVINGSLWTISVELTFYILLPILLYFYKKNKLSLFILFMFSFMFWIYDKSNSHDLFIDKLLHVSILPHLFVFIIGVAFYKFFNHLKKFVEDKFLVWFLLFIVFSYLSLVFKLESYLFVKLIKWVFFSFLVFSFAFSFRGLSQKILYGNDYTYGIYIYHAVILNIFVELNLVDRLEYLLYVVILSLFFGVVSWHIIEKPILKLKKYSIKNIGDSIEKRYINFRSKSI